MNTEVTAYFATALDARKAINALERLGIEAGAPEPVPPVNGRPWAVVASPGTGSMTTRYPQAVFVDKVMGVVLKFGGTLQKVL